MLLRADWRPFFRKARQSVLHEGHGAERMVEARVFGAGKDEVADPELADASEALDLWRLDEVHNEVLGYRYEPVDGIGKELKALVGGHGARQRAETEYNGGRA